MKKKILCFSFIILFVSILFANTNFENQTINDYKALFYKGNIEDKLTVLNAVNSCEKDKNIVTQIINDSAKFVIEYSSLLKNDSDMIALTSKTVEYLAKTNQSTALNYLHSIFENYDSFAVKKAVLETLYTSNYKDSKMVSQIKDFATNLTTDKKNDIDFMLLLVDTMHKMEDSAFFDILFNYAASSTLSEQVSNAAKLALNDFTTDYKENMIRIISNNPIEEKYLALNLVINNSKNSDFLRAELAEKALITTIIYVDNVDSVCKEYIQFQLMAARELRRVAWTRSGDLIVSYFGIAKNEFENNLLTENEFIEVIECLSELASAKAGKILTDYLSYFNEQIEIGNVCSEPLVLAVIKALGSIGDKIAFDNLLLACYLPYTEDVKDAARMALAGLKF